MVRRVCLKVTRCGIKQEPVNLKVIPDLVESIETFNIVEQ